MLLLFSEQTQPEVQGLRWLWIHPQKAILASLFLAPKNGDELCMYSEAFRAQKIIWYSRAAPEPCLGAGEGCRPAGWGGVTAPLSSDSTEKRKPMF